MISSSVGLWVGFVAFVLAMLAVDLGIFQRKAHAITMREAGIWTVVWITLALMFGAGLYFFRGSVAALEYFAGYLIEKALSVDNIFVFVLIFSFFGVPAKYQHRVLFWGVLGALVLRGVFIAVGATLLARFHWVMYIFGAFLVFTGFRLAFQRETEMQPDRNPFVRFVRRLIPVTPDFQGERFLVRRDGRWMATPLLLVLLVVESTDVVFAVDSIPAVFAVTRDPFIVFTSNVFAILGLRSLYFLLASAVAKFHYLKISLAVILSFVGVKMLIAEVYKIPVAASLAVIAGLLVLGVVGSLIRARRLAQRVSDPERSQAQADVVSGD